MTAKHVRQLLNALVPASDPNKETLLCAAEAIERLFNRAASGDLLSHFRIAHGALHVLWTAHANLPGYVKRPWRDLDNAVSDIGQAAKRRIGYLGPLLPGKASN